MQPLFVTAFVAMGGLFFGNQLQAQSDADAPELSDAVQESPDVLQTPKTPVSEVMPWLNWRAKLSSTSAVVPSDRHNHDRQGETSRTALRADLAVLVKPDERSAFFLDGSTFYNIPESQKDLTYNQLGIRLRPAPRLNFAFGKERNVRAPGLVVNPSDFIHPPNNLPGERQQTEGVWLARSSYQTETWSLDAIYLPYRQVDHHGLPQKSQTDRGGVGRAFATLQGYDFGLTAGEYSGDSQLGMSMAGYLAKSWETHAELGLRSGRRARVLAGGRWDLGSSGSLTLEGYFNGQGLAADEFTRRKQQLKKQLEAQVPNTTNFERPELFPRQWYVIAGTSWTELFEILNTTLTAVASPEDSSCFVMSRLEYLASSRSTLAATVLVMAGPSDGQYALRQSDSIYGVEWALSF